MNIEDLDVAPVNVFPNPTNGMINIETDDFIQVDIIDINSRFLRSENQNQIDISELKKGIYILKIYTSNKVSVRKVVLE